ncbi:MAG: AmmeMemoRadiSam system protein A [Chloroflexota bacterium]
MLLQLARQSLENCVKGFDPLHVDEKMLTPALLQKGASFVTLTISGQLRGCIGSLEPYQALYQDVCEHAIAAALHDYRFSPVRPSELPRILVEVSYLTLPKTLIYQDPQDLLNLLQPGQDGVILRDGSRRATFLPQVWSQIPSKEEFLDHLCAKMGEPSKLWKLKHLDVEIYGVEEFHEGGEN